MESLWAPFFAVLISACNEPAELQALKYKIRFSGLFVPGRGMVTSLGVMFKY